MSVLYLCATITTYWLPYAVPDCGWNVSIAENSGRPLAAKRFERLLSLRLLRFASKRYNYQLDCKHFVPCLSSNVLDAASHTFSSALHTSQSLSYVNDWEDFHRMSKVVAFAWNHQAAIFWLLVSSYWLWSWLCSILPGWKPSFQMDLFLCIVKIDGARAHFLPPFWKCGCSERLNCYPNDLCLCPSFDLCD